MISEHMSDDPAVLTVPTSDWVRKPTAAGGGSCAGGRLVEHGVVVAQGVSSLCFCCCLSSNYPLLLTRSPFVIFS